MSNHNRTVALDTETTGFSFSAGHRILEIAALEFDEATGLPLDAFHEVIDPQRDVPAEVSAVHGWTSEKLQGKPLFKDIAPQLLEMCSGAHLVIHNAPFDVPFVDSELMLCGMPRLSDVAASITDTLALSRTWLRMRSNTLDALCARYGVSTAARVHHGALLDCELLASVYPGLKADSDDAQRLLNAVLPRPHGQALPQSRDELAHVHLAYERLLKVINAEQKRYTEALREACGNADAEGPGWAVVFTNRGGTNWDKVKKDHLKDVDLTPYEKKPVAAMSVKETEVSKADAAAKASTGLPAPATEAATTGTASAQAQVEPADPPSNVVQFPRQTSIFDHRVSASLGVEQPPASYGKEPGELSDEQAAALLAKASAHVALF